MWRKPYRKLEKKKGYRHDKKHWREEKEEWDRKDRKEHEKEHENKPEKEPEEKPEKKKKKSQCDRDHAKFLVFEKHAPKYKFRTKVAAPVYISPKHTATYLDYDFNEPCHKRHRHLKKKFLLLP